MICFGLFLHVYLLLFDAICMCICCRLHLQFLLFEFCSTCCHLHLYEPNFQHQHHPCQAKLHPEAASLEVCALVRDVRDGEDW